MFRSETTKYFRMHIPVDSGWEIMNELGKMDMIQFEDLQRDKLAAHKSFAKNVHRCEEMKIRVDRLMEISEVNGWPLTYCDDHPKFFKAFTTF